MTWSHRGRHNAGSSRENGQKNLRAPACRRLNREPTEHCFDVLSRRIHRPEPTLVRQSHNQQIPLAQHISQLGLLDGETVRRNWLIIILLPIYFHEDIYSSSDLLLYQTGRGSGGERGV